MSYEVELRASGLFTDPSPHSDAPPGALLEAQNVVIRRPGVIEPRPGFRDTTNVVDVGYRMVSMHDYNGQFIRHTRDTTTGTAHRLLNGSGSNITLNAAVIDFDNRRYSMAEVGKTLFIASADGVLFVEDATDTTALHAGMPRGQSGFADDASTTATGETPIEDTKFVRYRVVYAHEINGRLVLGAPSGMFVYENNSGSAKAVSLRLPLPDEAAGGWKLQVYRSKAADSRAALSDELFLALEHELTTTEITANEVTLVDSAAEDELGASLYTNETQQGALQEATRPPVSNAVHAFESMLFCGGTKQPHRLIVQFLRPFRGYVAEYVAPAAPDGDFVSSGTGVTNIGDLSGDELTLSVGRYIASNGQDYPGEDGSVLDADTLITARPSATSLTLSQGANATLANANIEVFDWVTIAGQVYYCAATVDRDLNAGWCSWESGIEQGVEELACAINLRSDGDLVAAHLGDGFLLLERDPANADTSITFQTDAIRADWVSPSVPAAGPDYIRTSEQEDKPHRLHYSKRSQPESIPLTHFVDLGSEQSEVLAMESVRGSLFVWKDDGVWRVTGKTPETLRVERFMPSSRLIHEKAIAKLDETIYYLDNDGLRTMTEGGTANVTAGPLETTIAELLKAISDASDPGEGCFVSTLRHEGWVLMGLPPAASGDGVQYTYVLDTKTGAWARWTMPDDISCGGELGASLYLGGVSGADAAEYTTRASTDYAPFGDTELSWSIASSTTNADGSLTVESDGAVPSVGAFARRTSDGALGVVIAVSGSDVTIWPLTSFPATGETSFTTWEPVPVVIEWIARTAKAPMVSKHYSMATLGFEEARRLRDMTLSFGSDRNATKENVSITLDFNDDEGPEPVRAYVTRNQARCAQLFPRLAFSQGGARWSLTSLQLTYNMAGDRVGMKAAT